jgi:pyruvate,water dikinase
VAGDTRPSGVRKRAATAERALRGRIWLDEFREWERVWKPELVQANRAFGAVEPSALDDDELAAHVEAVADHLRRSTTLHFRLHTSDLGPIGLLLVRAREWGLDERMLMDVLAGSSPSTSAPAMMVRAIRDAIDSGDAERRGARRRTSCRGRRLGRWRLRSLDDIRRSGDNAARLLDEYLEEYGSRLTTGYDISDLTLAELPDVIVASVRDDRGAGEPSVDERADARGAVAFAELRAGLSTVAVTEFDELVEDARLLYGLRDENGPDHLRMAGRDRPSCGRRSRLPPRRGGASR